MGRRGTVWQIDGLPATPTQNLPREKWLELRRTGIGGSDIAGIMGVSPWATELSVYCEKVGLLPDREANEAMEFGTMMEPVLRNWTAAKLNGLFPSWQIKVFSSPYLYRSERNEHWLGNCDAVVTVGRLDDLRDENLWAGGEFKVVDRSKAKEWADGAVPIYVNAQVQWYMLVTGMLRWILAPLIGKRFEVRLVERDPDLISRMVDAAEEFWHKVETRTMPEARAEDTRLLTELYQEAGEDYIQLPELANDVYAYQVLGEELRQKEKERKALQAELMQHIGAYKGLDADGYRVTWSRYTQTYVDSKKLKAEYPDIYEQVASKTPTGRLYVKGEKSEEGL